MQDWISDDITFCLKDCDIDCERNQKNIRHKELPHSYSDFSESDYCPIEREKKMQDEMNDFVNPYYKDPDSFVSVVRCWECKDWYPFADKQFGYCRRQCWDDEGQYRLKVETAHDDFCSYGAMKE